MQRAALRAHEGARPRGQQVQIRLPRRAARQRAHLRGKARLGVDALNQPVHALMARAEPPARKPRLKPAQPFGERIVHRLAVAAHGLVKRHARVRRMDADARQLAVLQPQRRALERREQRLVLRAVVNRRQQRHHRADLRHVEIALARIAEDRDARPGEHIRRQRRAAPRHAHEHRHVPVAKRPLAPLLRVVEHRADQRLNARRGDLRLPLDGGQLPLIRQAVARLTVTRHGLFRRVVRAVLRFPGPVDQMQLQRRVVRPRGQTGDERLARIVFDLRGLPAHDPREDRVDAGEHVGAGAKVALQVDAPRALLRLAVVERRLAQEELRLCLAEAVDTLLDVADEKLPVLPREAPEDRLLNRARILVFVDEDVAVAGAQRLAHLGMGKRLQRAMLQIVKIQHAASPFCRAIERVIGAHQLRQALKRRARQAQILRRLLKRGRKARRQLAHGLLERIAPRLDRLRQRLVKDVALLLSPQRRVARLRQRGAQGHVALPCRAEQVNDQRGVLRAGRGVMCRAVRAAANRERLLRIRAEAAQRRLGVREQQLHGWAFAQCLRVRAAGRDGLVKPAPGVGARHHEAAQAPGQLGKLLLRIARVRRQKRLAADLVAAVERVLHRLGAQHAAFLLVRDAEGGVEPQRLKVLAQQVAAEPVQRRDARPGERHRLLAHRRVLKRRAAERLADAQAHLARRRVGKRHHEHLLDRASLAHERHDPLHEHGGLARARRRADDQAVPPVRNRVPLLPRPLRHDCVPPLCVMLHYSILGPPASPPVFPQFLRLSLHRRLFSV